MHRTAPAELPGRAIWNEGSDVSFFRLRQEQRRPQALFIGSGPGGRRALRLLRGFSAFGNMAFDRTQLPYGFGSETLFQGIDEPRPLFVRRLGISGFFEIALPLVNLLCQRDGKPDAIEAEARFESMSQAVELECKKPRNM